MLLLVAKLTDVLQCIMFVARVGAWPSSHLSSPTSTHYRYISVAFS